jgi:dipeptidyl aminopeptidase/acylaminoacyl peptidase
MMFPRACCNLIASIIVAIPAIAGAQAPAAAWTPELMLTVKRVSSVNVSAAGDRVAYVVAMAIMEGERSYWLSHIWTSRSDGTGAQQLTQGDSSSTAPRWSSDGRWLYFLSTRYGRNNVWRIRPDGGEAERVTDAKKSPVLTFALSPAGSRLAFRMADSTTDAEDQARKERRDWRIVDSTSKLTRLYVAPVDLPVGQKWNAQKLTTGDYSVQGFEWSPDGRSIVFHHRPSPVDDDWTKADISVVDVATAQTRLLAATNAGESQPRYSPDGRWIAFAASDDPVTWGGTSHVLVVASSGGTPRRLAETFDVQPGIVGWSPSGDRIYVAETQRTVNRLSALPINGNAPIDISPAELMVNDPTLNERRTHIGFVSVAPDKAPEAFVATLPRWSATQVSRVQNLAAAPLGRSEVITWTAPDGKQIEGVLTYPAGYRAGTRVPLLVVVHGGPAGVFTRSFTGSAGVYPIAAFATRGYAVLRANVRGSSGYGRDFRYSNYKDWGGGDYQDILSGVDALVQRGVADPDRLGVMGWSYGGYMTSWIITQTNRFKAASVGAGVTNLMSFTGTSDIPSFLPDYFGGEFWDVFDIWRSRSAMFNIRGVTTPTLIQHGEADVRVPISQGYELYNALKRQRVPVKMVVYPRQPHGLQEPRHILDAARQNLEWFERWIPVSATAASSTR